MSSAHIIATCKILCPPGSDQESREFLADFSQTIPFLAAAGLRILFWLFYWLPPLIIFRFRSLARLSATDQARYLAWWENNRCYFIREILNNLKTVALLVRVRKEWDPNS